ncbi:MAG: pyruvate dehydrogenase (acetyl-transferring) E1 component subunit alpha [Phycisphaerales bacterium]|jgi:pyruvate dehydrogenase E1 component alpha subunit|nr:pyruvate dehydrogenase (acetyl-transferring) E1 component subunit alpha [Phycisphaerales bacterium]
MPLKTVYEARIEYLQILDEDGKLDEKLAKGTLTDEQVAFSLEQMLICRELDETAFKLQRSGRMGTYPQNKGQEACAVGSGLAAIKGQDYLVPCYRENAALFLHGLPMHYILLHWMGDERGNQIPEGVNVTPISIPIGTQMLHATGIAWAYKIRKEPRCVITYFGDGATSEGDFHEAMNFASTFQAPVVFFCQNNQWAISVPRETQTASETIAQKAIAYGMPSMQVDGNDLFAVYKATKDALDRARAGGGPALIEGVTYRLGDHTTADDAKRYRDPKEVEAWQAKDPVIRLRAYLERKGMWSDEKHAQTIERARKITAEVVRTAEGIEKPHSADFFNHMFAELDPELIRQRDSMRTSSLGQYPEQEMLRRVAERV